MHEAQRMPLQRRLRSPWGHFATGIVRACNDSTCAFIVKNSHRPTHLNAQQRGVQQEVARLVKHRVGLGRLCAARQRTQHGRRAALSRKGQIRGGGGCGLCASARQPDNGEWRRAARGRGGVGLWPPSRGGGAWRNAWCCASSQGCPRTALHWRVCQIGLRPPPSTPTPQHTWHTCTPPHPPPPPPPPPPPDLTRVCGQLLFYRHPPPVVNRVQLVQLCGVGWWRGGLVEGWVGGVGAYAATQVW